MPGCEPPPRVSGAALAAEWPRRIGQRIRLQARVEQALDVTRVITIAGGHRFAVMIAPDAIWTGEREVVLTILGATTVLTAGGPQRVPELIHASDPCDDAVEAR